MAGLPFLQNIQKATGLGTWQIISLLIVLLFAANYLTLIFIDHYGTTADIKGPSSGSVEGFTSSAEESKYKWLSNDELYDDFYASVYDLLVQPSNRTQFEISFLLSRWKFNEQPNGSLKSLCIADLGCGTGVSAAALAKSGIGRVVAIDKSAQMIDFAKKANLPSTVLTEEQKSAIEFRERDLLDPSAARGSEFDAAVALYFTIYYMRDMDGFFRNCALWIKPGGFLAVQVVNKYKFDPMLDSASPFIFSLQRYSEQRATKSAVKFDKFDYEGVFDLDEEANNAAEFRETFRFKDGTVRRQRHNFYMYDIAAIVKKAKAAGWTYQGYIDQEKQGFAYSYLLMFKH